jgi:hypothetical protein
VAKRTPVFAHTQCGFSGTPTAWASQLGDLGPLGRPHSGGVGFPRSGRQKPWQPAADRRVSDLTFLRERAWILPISYSWVSVSGRLRFC